VATRGDELREAAAWIDDTDPDLARHAREVAELLDALDQALLAALKRVR